MLENTVYVLFALQLREIASEIKFCGVNWGHLLHLTLMYFDKF